LSIEKKEKEIWFFLSWAYPDSCGVGYLQEEFLRIEGQDIGVGLELTAVCWMSCNVSCNLEE